MKTLVARPFFYPAIVSLVIVALFGLFWWLVRDAHIAVLEPRGEIAEQQQQLILFTVVLSAIVVVPVFGLLAYFAFQYRAGNTKATYQPEWSKNNVLEAVWWGIPIIIIIVLSVVTYVSTHALDPYKKIESTKEPVTVQVIALQWKWLFIYPEHGVATVNDLTIPVDRPVSFQLSADAPMSAFWIPDLGSQIYSMNAMTSQLNLIANTKGQYTGYNTNINGEGYARMTFTTNVVSEDEFATWHQNYSTSGHALTMHHYTELSEPSTISSPMYMRLEDADLYDSIVGTYMMQSGHGMSDYDDMNAEGHH